MRLVAISALAALVLAASHSEPQEDHSTTAVAAIAESLETFVGTRAARDEFSGAVLVAKDGKPFFAQAYGMADKDEKRTNRLDTRFNLGSMNKMFTAVAVAQLAERGKLSFNDPISKHVPDYPNRAVADKVTIHQLLTHSSGMGDYQNESYYARLDDMKTVADLVPLFANDPLSFEPGEGWDYSNAGFVVLGLIIEKVSGQNYFDFVEQHVFKPAGMTSTGFYERDSKVSNRAVGYMRVNAEGEPDSDSPRRENTSTRPARGSPAGGAYSTVGDMLKFRSALVDHTLLKSEHTAIVMTGQVKVPAGWPMTEYGYGFAVSSVDSTRIVGHGGTGLGVAGKFDIYPEIGYTVVILSNYDLHAMMPVVMKSRELILQQSSHNRLGTPPRD